VFCKNPHDLLPICHRPNPISIYFLITEVCINTKIRKENPDPTGKDRFAKNPGIQRQMPESPNTNTGQSGQKKEIINTLKVFNPKHP
jgi:hypothetical protein